MPTYLLKCTECQPSIPQDVKLSREELEYRIASGERVGDPPAVIEALREQLAERPSEVGAAGRRTVEALAGAGAGAVAGGIAGAEMGTRCTPLQQQGRSYRHFPFDLRPAPPPSFPNASVTPPVQAGPFIRSAPSSRTLPGRTLRH